MSLEVADQYDAQLAAQQCNLGISIGPHSNLIVIDIDIQNPELVDMLYAEIQQTPARKLGSKGFSCFYKSDGSLHKSFLLPTALRDKIGEPKAKIEVLADNHYTVLPPSIHPDTGQPYQWLEGYTELVYAELPVFDRPAFIKLLTDVGIDVSVWGSAEIVLDNPEQVPATTTRGRPAGTRNREGHRAGRPVGAMNQVQNVYRQGAYQESAEIREYIGACLNNISPNCSNDTWVYVGYAINHGVTGQEGYEIFKNWSSKSPQWSENLSLNETRARELFFNTAEITTAQKTVLYLMHQAKSENVALELSPKVTAIHKLLQLQVTANRYDIGNLDDVSEYVERFELPESLGDTPVWSERVHAELIRQVLGDNLIAIGKVVKVFVADTGRWHEVTKDDIGHLSSVYDIVANHISNHPDTLQLHRNAEGVFMQSKKVKFDAGLHTTHRCLSVCKRVLVECAMLTQLDWADFDSDPEIILLNNRQKVNMRTGDVSEAVATDYLTMSLPCKVGEANSSGRVTSMLMDTFAENDDPAAMVSYMQELFGYFISGSVSRQEMYIFSGMGANGKSFMFRILSTLLGVQPGNVAGDALKEDFIFKRGLSQQATERIMVSLVHRRLCMVRDMDIDVTWEAGLIKLVTGDTITARHLYAERATHVNSCKMVFGCNEVPKLHRADFALQRRLVNIPFKRTFMADPEAENRLMQILREDIDGLCRWAIEGRMRTLKNGGVMQVPQEVLDTTSKYIMDNNPIDKAIESACHNRETDNFVTNAEIVTCVMQWLQHIDPSLLIERDPGKGCSPEQISARLSRAGFRKPVNGIKQQGKLVRGWFVELKYPENKQQIEQAKGGKAAELDDLIN